MWVALGGTTALAAELPPQGPPGAALPTPFEPAAAPAIPDPDVAASESLLVAVPARPKLGLSVGMGITWDSTGFVDRARGRVPSFAALMEGRGARFGVALGLLATSGSGRFPYRDRPVDRLGFRALVTFRPWAEAEDIGAPTFVKALLRELTLAAGPGYEHAAAGTLSTGRFGLEGALMEDVVLFREATGSDVRLRLTVRRFWAASSTVGSDTVIDSLVDVGLALAVVF